MAPEIAAKMAKLLRMLTSPHDGEVLAAANRLNAITIANSIDWDQALAGGERSPSQEEMQQVYAAGYERGLADGAKSAQSANGHDDWANAGTSRTEGVGMHYGHVAEICNAVTRFGGTDFEVEFCSDFQRKLNRWGNRTFVSEKQWRVFDRIWKRLVAEGISI